MIFQKIKGNDKYGITKILLDGPIFDFSDEDTMAMEKDFDLLVSNGSAQADFLVKFNVDVPLFRASYTKTSMMKFNKPAPIDDYVKIDGPFYHSNIVYSPLDGAVHQEPTPAELKVECYSVDNSYVLDSDVRFYIDSISVDKKQKLILGYTFYEPG